MRPNYNFSLMAMGLSHSFTDFFSTQQLPQRITNHYNVPVCYIFLKLIGIMKEKFSCSLKTPSKVASENIFMKQS